MATLTNETIASTYPLLLKIDSSGVDSTLRKVEDGDATDSSLYISTTSIGIDSTDKFYLDADQGTPHTYFHQVSADKLDVVVGGQTILELSEGGGGSSDFLAVQALNKVYLDGGGSTYIQESADGVMTFVCDARTMLTLTQGSAGTGEVCVNEGSNADVDFRVESNGEDEAILVDATNNTLYVNKGNTAFTTKIGSLNSTGFEGLQVSSAGVIINDGGHANCDFRVESENEDQAIFLNSDTNTLYINLGETAFATHIHNINDVGLSVTSAGVILNDDGHAENDFRIESENNTHMFFVNSDTDRISIGTAGGAPGAKVHVEDTGDPNLQIMVEGTALTDTDYATFTAIGTGNSVVNQAEIGVIYENSSDTDAPTSFIRLEASDGAISYIFVGDDDELKITTTKTNIGKISGITVVGDQTSDERLKNISNDAFPYGLSEVNAMTPIKFTYKDVKTPVDTLGFGAQTIQSIIPESVTQTNDCLDGYDEVIDEDEKQSYIPKSDNNKMMMQYHQLIPVLVKAVQELSAKVTALEAA